MQRFLLAAISLAFVATLSTGASAKSCRDAKGKFTKCPAATSSKMAPKHCRDAKGKFTKCSSSMSSSKM